MEEVTLLDFNKNRGGQPKLVAIYPDEGTFYSDNPFIVLDAPWVSRRAARGRAASSRSSWPRRSRREVAARAGFRPADLKAKPVAPITQGRRRRPGAAQARAGAAGAARARRGPHARGARTASRPTCCSCSTRRVDERREPARAGEGRARDVPARGVAQRPRRADDVLGPRSSRWCRSRRCGRTGPQLQSTVNDLIADGGTAFYDATAEGVETVKRLNDRRAHQRGRAAHRRRGHRLVADRRRGGASGSRRRATARTACACSRSRSRPSAAGAEEALERIAAASGGKAYSGHTEDIELGLPEHLELLLGRRGARPPDRPPTRAELNRLLVGNALTKPLPNVVVPAGGRGRRARRRASACSRSSSRWSPGSRCRRSPTSTATRPSASPTRTAPSGGGRVREGAPARAPARAGAADRRAARRR